MTVAPEATQQAVRTALAGGEKDRTRLGRERGTAHDDRRNRDVGAVLGTDGCES